MTPMNQFMVFSEKGERYLLDAYYLIKKILILPKVIDDKRSALVLMCNSSSYTIFNHNSMIIPAGIRPCGIERQDYLVPADPRSVEEV